jgi:phospholipid/cholesterol/gamma-HCH transport system substrate-binding protein
MLFNLNNSSVEIDSALTSLNNLMTTIQTQKSAFNYIVKDTAATKEIDETLKNINKGSELLNENLEALKHSFLLRGYFKKQEGKKEKQQKN